MLVFGIVGFVASTGDGLEWFAQSGLPSALGLKANPAFSLLSIVVGAIVVLGVLIGRNVDRVVNLVAGSIQLLASMGMLAVLRTDLNFLGFSVATCVVSSILGLTLLTAGLYGKVGPRSAEQAQNQHRHRVVGGDNT
ncbi:DUF4383 domain-containing protein [Stackebrandtia soli]